MEDEDYIKESENNKKKATRNKKVGRVLSGLAGAGGGALLGAAKGGKKLTAAGAIVGTAAGAGLGHLVGKREEKKVHEAEDKAINRYKNASEHDKKYLRKKREFEKVEALHDKMLREQERTRRDMWLTHL